MQWQANCNYYQLLERIDSLNKKNIMAFKER